MRRSGSMHLLSWLLCGTLCLGALIGRAEAAKTNAVDPDKPMVALTYDDGPYSPVTNRILDALAQVDGRATFFVVGNRVAGCASVVRRAGELGCQIGNHSWDHTDLTSLDEAHILEQIDRCNAAVRDVLGTEPTMVRPVGGAVNSLVHDAVCYPMILWSVDTEDWRTENADATCLTVLEQVEDGDIILMHDLYPATAEASERLIPELVRRGFQLVTVEELARYRGYEPVAHTTYTRFQ